MPVLDVRKLSARQLTKLADHYDRIAVKELQALARLENDPVRQEIDLALSTTLRIPAFSFVRELLAREPGLSAVGISPRTNPPEEMTADGENETEDEQSAIF